MTRRSRGLGAALILLYVAVAVVTSVQAPGRLRPLFDGFASHPGEYGWVRPPREFAQGNRLPVPVEARLNLAADGSSPVIAETADGQALASLPPGAVPPHGADAAATVALRPLDSATLGALPPGLRPEGNAYRLTITYLPSGAPASTLSAPGTVGLTSKAASDALLYSADGRSWQPVAGQRLSSSPGFTGPLTQVGYYVVAGKGPPRAAASSRTSAPLALFVVAVAVPLGLGYLFFDRRRRGSKEPRSVAPTASSLPKKPRPPKR